MKRISIVLALILTVGFIYGPKIGMARTLLTQEQAIQEMFPDVDEVSNRTLTASNDQINRIKEKLGGSLIHYQRGSESEMVQEKTEFKFLFGIKDGKEIGVAMIEEQPGKWGPVTYIIMLDPATAKVKNLAVMSYKEKRGRPIARRSFLKQFIDKGSSDPIKVRKDIRGISGATISSDATCFAVKKVIVVYEELFLKGKLTLKE